MDKRMLKSLIAFGLTAILGNTLSAAAVPQPKGKLQVHLRAKAKPVGEVGEVGKDTTIPLDGAQGISVPLGTAITWSADVNNSNGGVLWYRYRVTRPDGVQRMIRDFGPSPELSWTTVDAQGVYEMELTVRRLDSAEVNVDTAAFQFQPLALGDKPAVTPTTHPQVLIYSAPSCPAGSTMKVQYIGPSAKTEETPEKACGDGTMNFYVGGLRKQSTYTLRHVVTDAQGSRTFGPAATGMSGTPIYQFAESTVPTPAAANAVNPVMLYGPLFEPIHATDLDGNVIWYYLSQLTTVTRPDGNGKFWGFAENPSLAPDSQVLRQFDLAGSTLLETNAARINEQLALMGKPPITGFHHEVRPMPNGNIMTLAGTEQILSGVQGDGDVDVLGDMILVLNRDLEVVWAWNSFDYLDANRSAVLGEQCSPNGAGCAPFYKATSANDWVHGNALQLTADGNILYSARHQDWVIKIDFQNGGGSGQILWRMGKGGDFSISSSDPNPWFSHQHDPNFDLSDPTMFYVFDNGNTRQSVDPGAHSRGQVYKIDEQARTATPVLSVDLDNYSLALGSAARLPNGNYHFDLGWIQKSTGASSRSVEVNPAGQIVYEIRAPTAFYRTFRLASLYAAESR